MFSKQLKKLRNKEKLTQAELAHELGVSKSAISMYENGKRQPDFETEELIADYFNIDINTLRGLASPLSKGVKIPVLGYVRAGVPIEAVEDILDYEEISQRQAQTGDFFALKIKGDSMEPKISEGDVVIVKKQNSVENGELAVVLINGDDATVKRFYRSANGIKLISSNPIYDPFFFTPADVENLPVRVIGKVVELRAKF